MPAPPPELPTPTPGSGNPENDASQLQLTPVRATPDRGFTPIAAAPGHVYFVRGDRLWTISPDGTGERQLSDLPITGRPAPSPDGKQVAWVADNDLYVMPAEGGEARKIYTGDITERLRLGWSPDGKLIGIMVYDAANVGKEKALAVPLDGSSPTELTTMESMGGDRGPSYERTVQWSPDFKWVVVGGVNNPMRLMRWPLRTGNKGDVQDIAGGEPDWSPDSRTLLYTETLGGAVLIYGVLQAEATPFRNEKEPVGTGLGEYSQGPGPLWSPASAGADSDILVYRSRGTSGEPTVAVRTRRGRDLDALPALTNNPAWSPSGDTLVVETGSMAQDALGPKWTPNGLATVKVNLAGEHTLTPLTKDAKWPAWGK